MGKIQHADFISTVNVDIEQSEVMSEDQSIYNLKIIVHSENIHNLTSSSLIEHEYRENLAIINGDIEYTFCCTHSQKTYDSIVKTSSCDQSITYVHEMSLR